MRRTVYHALADAARSGEPVALGIISAVKGSSPQKVGAKAVFHRDGRIESTLGGGCLEAEVQQRAIQSLASNQPSSFELLLDHDFGWDDGLICGGNVSGLILPNAQSRGAEFWEVLAQRNEQKTWCVRRDYSIDFLSDTSTSALYTETLFPPCHLWIAGAGHIAQAVAPLAANVDFRVSVFDDRPALANRHFFPGDVQLFADDWSRLLGRGLPSVPTLGLIVTRGHRHDALVLRDWIQKPFAFLGMIGSSRKARIIREHFLEEKIATTEQWQRFACPVGIDIQSRSVEEIAVSIVAQFIEKRAGLR